MDVNERTVRQFYEARARRDWDAVRSFLDEEVAWHEPGAEDYSGNYRGRDDVITLLARLVAITDGTFQLAPEAFLNTAEHTAALVRWSAERAGRAVAGSEIAVYRLDDRRIAEAWFHPDDYDADALSAVFAYE